MKTHNSQTKAAHIATFTPFVRATAKATRKTTLTLFSVAVLLAGGAAAARGQSPLDGFDPNADNTVRVVVVQPDGKTLIGGNFSTVLGVARSRIARLNADGTLDTAFAPNANNEVDSIAVQPDGKILVGGNFSNIGGQVRFNIARLDPATGAADSWNPSTTGGAVYSIAVQADGKILAGGLFTTIGGQPRNRIARLDANTGLADSFDPNANSTVTKIVVQADGKILVGGGFNGANSIGGQLRNNIARLDPVTGLADSWNPNANAAVFSDFPIAIQADGKILVGGNFSNIGGQPRNRIARLDPVTGLADSWNPSADNLVLSIAVQADGKILAGGYFLNIGGQPRNRIARLDAVTGLADSFDPNANNVVYSIALQQDGKVLVGGDFSTLTPNGGAAVTRNSIARLETDGRLDQTLNLSIVGSGSFGDVLAIAVQPDGKTLIGGDFTSVLGVARNGLARLNTDGTLDTAFNPNSGATAAIAVQADGKIFIGGQGRLVKLNPDGTRDTAFNANPNSSVGTIVVQADGKILAGGAFHDVGSGPSIGGQTRNYIARLDPTTGLADSFNPNASALVFSIAVQADGKILVIGIFDPGATGAITIGGQARKCIARLDPVTGLADSFNPNPNGDVRSIAVQPDGKILVGGSFRDNPSFPGPSIGGQSRNFIARLDAVTGLADSFDPNADGGLESIEVQADGKILVGGAFVTIGGQPRNRIARLDAVTGLADSFDPNATGGFFPGSASSIVVKADGKILAGGLFTSIGGQPRNFFARLSNDTAALQNLAVTQTTITWTRGGSSPQFVRVTFESSTDNVNYTPLGNGTAAGNNWTLTGLSLSTGQNIYIRARGYYRGGYLDGSGSIAEFVTKIETQTPVNPTLLGNISTRLRVETGDNALIGGFIVTGTQAKRVIVRAIGPSLPFAGALADPTLELRDSSGGLIQSNDNWRSDHEAEIIATTIPPSNDLESAIVATLPANNSAYTAIVRGANNGTGIGVVEAYDLDGTVDSKLANISTRGLVQTGDNVLIGGLIVLGQDPLRVIVRAIGPSLPVSGALADPTLELHDGNGALLAANDNWRSDQEAEIIATTVPPSNDLESAIVRNLPPGNYTAVVRGVNNSTGVGLVEAYGLN